MEDLAEADQEDVDEQEEQVLTPKARETKKTADYQADWKIVRKFCSKELTLPKSSLKYSEGQLMRMTSLTVPSKPRF